VSHNRGSGVVAQGSTAIVLISDVTIVRYQQHRRKHLNVTANVVLPADLSDGATPLAGRQRAGGGGPWAGDPLCHARCDAEFPPWR
jgi:hypothetical protein